MNNQFVSLPVYGQVIKKETKWTRQVFYLVKSPTHNNEEILISSSIIDKSASFNNKFDITEKVNKHQLAEKLVYSNGTIFTIEFEKQDKTIRTLIGYLSSTDTLMGYSTVVDIEEWIKTNNTDKSKRTVYHSKLLSLIISNVKYELK